MSSVVKTVNLTLYGCPMHYIKAREVIHSMEKGQTVIFEVNNGDAVDDVINSLRKDGQTCEIEFKQSLTTTIKVTKIND